MFRSVNWQSCHLHLRKSFLYPLQGHAHRRREEKRVAPFWILDWNTFYWEFGGMLAGFFGLASVFISILEPVLSDRPFDTTLFAFGSVCLLISLLAPEVTVRRSAGR